MILNFFSWLKEMLEGTDLYSAYQPLNYSDYAMDLSQNLDSKPAETKVNCQPPTPPMKQQAQPQLQQLQPLSSYDAISYNKQLDQEQRIMQALNQLQKKKDELVTVTQQQSYIDKLFNKKKELGKLLQFVFIIVLGLSIHALIEFYLTDYISNSDMSPWRQFFLRLLYPMAILFVLWNIKVFVK
jgi:hypothetical protein